MAGCSTMTDGTSSSSTLDVLEIIRRLQCVGFCLDLDAPAKGEAESGQDKLGALFERILSVLFKEIREEQEIRPFPAMLGDGRRVDLFRLYCLVRVKGGYDSVTAAGSWALVSAESGLDSAVGSAVKLIFIKYLDAVDRWLQKVLEKETGGAVGCEEKVGSSGVGADADVTSLFRGVFEEKSKDCERTPSSLKREQLWTPTRGNKLKHGLDRCSQEFSSLKRKQEALVGVLNWVRKVAKGPADLSIGKVPFEESRSKGDGMYESFSQVLLARQAMFLKRIPNSSTGGSLLLAHASQYHRKSSIREATDCFVYHSLQRRNYNQSPQKGKRQEINPSIYEDYIDADSETTERLRCSHKFLSLNKQSWSGSCSETSTVLRDISSSPVAGLFSKDQKRIPVGSFQATVPEWTGMYSVTSGDSDDAKWLGTRIWPPDAKENKSLNEHDLIGKGRQDTCGCERRGSVECVRFHVAEKRLRLKRELGSAFHGWRFDCIGEEVSLSWTEEEERKFKAVVRQNRPSLNKCFWDEANICFRSKRRRSLVSYYFNVFLLRRRSYQNRVTPNNVDSDDDESEFGFLSNAFGHDAVKVRNSKSICAQNKVSGSR